MPKSQALIILVGVVLVVLMGIYPPWLYVDDSRVRQPMGYAPIWKPPISLNRSKGNFFGLKFELDVNTKTANTIDFSKLLLQMGIVVVVTGGVIFVFRRVAL